MGFINKDSLDGGKADWDITLDGKPLYFGDMKMRKILVNCIAGHAANVCTIEFTVPYRTEKDKTGVEKLELGYDASKYRIGMKLIIKIGKFNDEKSKPEEVFSGFLESIDLKADEKGLTMVVLHGMDTKMWMMSNICTTYFKEKKKYADVVKEVFTKYSAIGYTGSEVKIKNDVELSGGIYCYEESHYDFLCRLADLTSSMFFVDEKGKLNFIHYSTNANSKKITLKYCECRLIESRFSVSVWGIPKDVEVITSDEKDFTKNIESKATKSGTVGVGKAASAIINKNVQEKVTIYDDGLGSQKNAKARAQAEYDRRVYNLIKNRIKVPGSPEFKLGNGIKLEDFGEPIDGEYVISEVSHIYNGSGVYLTELGLSSTKYNVK